MVNTNVFMSVHRITKIKMSKISQLENSGTYTTHLYIDQDNGERLEIVLFADKWQSLKVIGNKRE